MKPLLRHGDLTVWKVEDNTKYRSKKRKDNILAFGEFTGHKHQLRVKDLVTWDSDGDLEINGQKLTVVRAFTLPKETEVTHEEHKANLLEAGEYIVTVERERDPFLDSIRNVAD